MDEYLQFVPFESIIDSGFWHSLSSKKIDKFGLNDSPVEIHGYYNTNFQENIPSLFNIDYNAFEGNANLPKNNCSVKGTIGNMNTLEDFKNVDKNLLLNTKGEEIFSKIKSGEAISDVNALNSFCLLTFADLKKFKFYYWCSFPAIKLENKFKLLSQPKSIKEKFNDEQISSILKTHTELSVTQDFTFFIITQSNDDVKAHPLNSLSQLLTQKFYKIFFAFRDNSSHTKYPGWPLRNFLALILYHWHSHLHDGIEIVALREKLIGSTKCIDNSLILHIEAFPLNILDGRINCVGWERNGKNQLGPRMTNLSSSMDPLKLSETAVDLNLKLMKWRLVPDLSLEDIFACRCLLLGSGTLGCNVARCLLGWGIKHITFVDNSKISFSNPVRQSLFTYEDCLNGGGFKAATASAALKRIHPHVVSESIHMTIPMPGHSIPSNMIESVTKDVNELENLFDIHDAIFLLMDTRESRWLPTLLGRIKKKIVISAALGFDSYLVIRHGIFPSASIASQLDSALASVSLDVDAAARPETIGSSKKNGHDCVQPANLGCYFCNDVVAPGNSTMDRTLDLQCTVTRPGISMLAAAIAVEILVSLLTHPLKGLAGANLQENNSESVLGVIPHQVRGFLSRFEQIKPTSQCFDKCTACSPKVAEAYEKDGFNFLMKVFESPKFLEDLTGLSQMYSETVDSLLMNINDEDLEEFSMN